MRVKIDLSRCKGHGQCANALPEVFALVGDDPMELRGRVVHEAVTAGLEDAVREAALICPEEAIVVIEGEAGE